MMNLQQYRQIGRWHIHAAQCASKRRYGSRQAALRGLKAVLAHDASRGRERLQAYRCGWCGEWHLGNPPEQEQER